MIDFEKALNSIIVQAEESKNNLILMKGDQLDANYSFLNWTYFFQSAFNAIEEQKIVTKQNNWVRFFLPLNRITQFQSVNLSGFCTQIKSINVNKKQNKKLSSSTQYGTHGC